MNENKIIKNSFKRLKYKKISYLCEEISSKIISFVICRVALLRLVFAILANAAFLKKTFKNEEKKVKKRV